MLFLINRNRTFKAKKKVKQDERETSPQDFKQKTKDDETLTSLKIGGYLRC